MGKPEGFVRMGFKVMIGRKRQMAVLILVLISMAGCFRFPLLGPEENTPTLAEHVATDFYGVYVPLLQAFIGCRWFRKHDPFPEESCKGIWKRTPDDSMVPLKDSAFVIWSVEVSRNFQYLAYLREVGRDSVQGFPIMDAVLMSISDGDTIVIPRVPVSGFLRPSPYTPDVFYGVSFAHWGEWSIVWRIDFRDTTITPVDTCTRGLFWVLPGAKGDRVVCDVPGGPVNLALGFEASTDGDTLFFTDIRGGREFILPGILSHNQKIDFGSIRWIHDQDTLVIGSFTLEPGFNPIPVGRDLWWIPNVTEHMVEISPGGNP